MMVVEEAALALSSVEQIILEHIYYHKTRWEQQGSEINESLPSWIHDSLRIHKSNYFL
jgi:hypothetical protein